MPAIILIFFGVVSYLGWYHFSDEIMTSINRNINLGKLEGVVECVAQRENSIVQPNTTRDFCAKSLQVQSFGFFVKGRAGPDFGRERKIFSGKMGHTSNNWIATELNFKVDVVVAGKTESVEVLQPVWIEPNIENLVSIELTTLTDEVWKGLEECLKSSEFDSCLTWGVTDQFGVEIR